MSVTLQDIARRSNVSKALVSQVLRNPKDPRYLEATRERVLQAARELGYRPNRLATGLTQGRTQLLSLIVPWSMPGVLETAERTAQELGFHLMVQFTTTGSREVEHRALEAALEWRVDGLIWLPGGASADYEHAIDIVRSNGTRVVVLQNDIEQFEEADTVRADYDDGIVQGVEHLLGAGYEKIVYLINKDNLSYGPCQHRLDKFKTVMEGRDATGEVMMVQGQDPERRVDEASMKEQIERSRGLKWAVFADSDWLAVEALERFEQFEVSVPEVGILGTSDGQVGGRFRVGELCRPRLSAVRVPGEEIARRSIRLVIDRVLGQRGGEAVEEVLPVELIVRDSTRGR